MEHYEVNLTLRQTFTLMELSKLVLMFSEEFWLKLCLCSMFNNVATARQDLLGKMLISKPSLNTRVLPHQFNSVAHIHMSKISK